MLKKQLNIEHDQL